MRLIKSIGLAMYHAKEAYHDWRLGIRSKGFMVPSDYGHNADGCYPYLPLTYGGLHSVLRRVRLRPNQDVFIDFGSGLARVVAVAALMPFRKVIGVELSQSLHLEAQRNIDRVRPKLLCQDIELHQGDARDFAIPVDATVFYFFMPFDASILKTVLENIHRSVAAAPRPVQVIYVYPAHGVNLNDVKPQLPWLRLHEESPVESDIKLMLASIATTAT